VWIGLLEDKNSVVFGPAESLRRLLIGREGRRGIWWPGEDDEEAGYLHIYYKKGHSLY